MHTDNYCILFLPINYILVCIYTYVASSHFSNTAIKISPWKPKTCADWSYKADIKVSSDDVSIGDKTIFSSR